MPESPTVLVVIPTFNRVGLLRQAVDSVLRQDYRNVRVLIVDDSTSDETQRAFGSPIDERMSYVRNPTNLGLVRNWNRAFELADQEFLVLLQDDDRLGDGFIRAAVEALIRHSDATFAYALVETINGEGDVEARQDPPSLGAGLISGVDYLERIVAGENWVIHISSALWRRDAIPLPGPFDAPHTTHTIDFNLFFRSAAAGGFVALDRHLVQVRSHDDQQGRVQLGPMAAFGMIAERTDAIAYLLLNRRASDTDYREWLARRLLSLNQQRSEFAQLIEPRLGLEPSMRRELAARDISAVTGQRDRVVLIDDYELGDLDIECKVERFGESAGTGTPADSAVAISELEAQKTGGASRVVIAWPSAWWLDYYDGLRVHLEHNYRLLLRTSRVTVYDLTNQAPPGGV